MNAKKCGESLLMELIENNFCDIFALLDKNNYVDVCIAQKYSKHIQASHE